MKEVKSFISNPCASQNPSSVALTIKCNGGIANASEDEDEDEDDDDDDDEASAAEGDVVHDDSDSSTFFVFSLIGVLLLGPPEMFDIELDDVVSIEDVVVVVPVVVVDVG